jgi:hypothetical protein
VLSRIDLDDGLSDTGNSMDSKTFVKELEVSAQAAMAEFAAAAENAESAAETAIEASIHVPQLLQVALANEISVSDLAAAWMPSTREADVKITFAQQVGDEADHFRLVEGRLNALGVSTAEFVPPALNPLFAYLRSLETTVERIAAGPFTLESIAYQVNQQFMKFCEQAGEKETVLLYQKRIQPDELHHHQLGQKLLEKYAVTPEDQQRARQAAAKTLELARQVRLLTAQRLGTACFPGC